MKKTLLLLSLIGTFAYADVLPRPAVTPGRSDPALTAQVLCAKGFTTTTIRNVPESVKRQVYSTYGVQNHAGYCTGPEGCEVDHLISLELGGSNDPSNLWPQPFAGQWNAHDKDKLENRLHQLVCSGQVPLAQAQHDIATNWIQSFTKYGLTK